MQKEKQDNAGVDACKCREAGCSRGTKEGRYRNIVQWHPGTNDSLGAGTPLPEVEHINLLTSQVSQVATAAQPKPPGLTQTPVVQSSARSYLTDWTLLAGAR